MFGKRFIIGTVNQGQPKIGQDYSAFEQNTIFLSGVCESETFLDEPAHNTEARAFLKSIGFLALRITNIFETFGTSRIAELEADLESKQRYQKAMEFLFRNNVIGYFHQEPPLMTLSRGTVLKSDDLISVGYLSILEPKGEGIYNLKHDYQLERTQGPRYEKFFESH